MFLYVCKYMYVYMYVCMRELCLLFVYVCILYSYSNTFITQTRQKLGQTVMLTLRGRNVMVFNSFLIPNQTNILVYSICMYVCMFIYKSMSFVDFLLYVCTMYVWMFYSYIKIFLSFASSFYCCFFLDLGFNKL